MQTRFPFPVCKGSIKGVQRLAMVETLSSQETFFAPPSPASGSAIPCDPGKSYKHVGPHGPPFGVPMIVCEGSIKRSAKMAMVETLSSQEAFFAPPSPASGSAIPCDSQFAWERLPSSFMRTQPRECNPPPAVSSPCFQACPLFFWNCPTGKKTTRRKTSRLPAWIFIHACVVAGGNVMGLRRVCNHGVNVYHFCLIVSRGVSGILGGLILSGVCEGSNLNSNLNPNSN